MIFLYSQDLKESMSTAFKYNFQNPFELVGRDHLVIICGYAFNPDLICKANM